jgi:hypothetical protein
MGVFTDRLTGEINAFSDYCCDLLGEKGYERLFDGKYEKNLKFVGNNESGFFRGRFSTRQVFNCRRDPEYPLPGETFTVSDFCVPVSKLIKVNADTLKNKIFFFEGVEGENDSVRRISLWIGDNVCKSNPQCISAAGKVYGLGEGGFLYVSDIGTEKENGYFVSVKQPFNYGNERVTWAPDSGEVKRFSDLKNYVLPRTEPIY